jgi:hypothetical protein
MSHDTPTPITDRRERALRELVLSHGTELVVDETDKEAGIYLVGDAVFTVPPEGTGPCTRYPDLLSALEVEAEVILASGPDRVYRWRSGTVTVEDGHIVNVCPDYEWMSAMCESVFYTVSPGFNASCWGIVRWKEHHFLSEDDGLVHDVLDHPKPSWEAAWSHWTDDQFVVLPSSEVGTPGMDEEDFVRRFRVQGCEPATVRLNGRLVVLQPETELQSERGTAPRREPGSSMETRTEGER